MTESEPKSRSRETTFEHDLHPRHDIDAIRSLVVELSLQVADDVGRGGYRARTVGIKVRYDDFTRVTRDLSLSRPTADAGGFPAGGACLPGAPGDEAPDQAARREGKQSDPTRWRR